jgi:hypothetical protein
MGCKVYGLGQLTETTDSAELAEELVEDDPDPRGPKTCGSGGSGSATLSSPQLNASPPPPPHSHTVCTVYTVRLLWEGGRGGGQRKGRGATVHKRGRKYQHD